jgi:3-deoxy-D-manno-octulosonate 8-phosphate phosphatase KdsC-like HAD superfamily phosphatase
MKKTLLSMTLSIATTSIQKRCSTWEMMFQDMYVMERVGVATCPQDAVPDVKRIADYVSHKNGGDGCVREIVEQVMRVQNKWMFSDNSNR